MKFHSAWLLAIGFLLAAGRPLAAAPAPAVTNASVHYVAGLSPFLDRGVKDALYRQIIGYVLEELPLNSSLTLYDAYHLRTIASIEVPGVAAFRSAKTRANQFREPIRKLKDFLASPPEAPSAGPLKLDSAIRLPQFLDFLAEDPVRRGQTLRIALLGSPLYLDPKEPGFSMAGGYFPSDGHLQASREKTVYGLKERTGTLPGAIVYVGYFGDPWLTELHREKITRFWSLYVEGHGARLATFTSDLPTLFGAFHPGAPEPRAGTHELDRSQTKLEMLRITRDVGAMDWITRDAVLTAQTPPTRFVGPLKIGIRWKGDIDLDLYATPKPGGETLFFEHTRIPEGYYFKDHRSSPEREFEFIEFESPVDVREVEARINYFEGHTEGGPSGEIRLEFDGRIYSGQFKIEADHGNEGRDGRRQTEFWTQIDLPRLLRLPGPTAEAAVR